MEPPIRTVDLGSKCLPLGRAGALSPGVDKSRANTHCKLRTPYSEVLAERKPVVAEDFLAAKRAYAMHVCGGVAASLSEESEFSTGHCSGTRVLISFTATEGSAP